MNKIVSLNNDQPLEAFAIEVCYDINFRSVSRSKISPVKVFKYLPMFMVIAIALTACCTKVECGVKQYPSLGVELVDFNASGKGMVKLFDSTSTIAVDSFEYQYNNFHIDYVENERDIRAMTYVINSDEGRRDTISKINFEIFDFMNNCNKCLFSEQGEIATNYRNLEYHLNGKKYENTTTVKIYK
jgi:hypothetical protein